MNTLLSTHTFLTVPVTNDLLQHLQAEAQRNDRSLANEVLYRLAGAGGSPTISGDDPVTDEPTSIAVLEKEITSIIGILQGHSNLLRSHAKVMDKTNDQVGRLLTIVEQLSGTTKPGSSPVH